MSSTKLVALPLALALGLLPLVGSAPAQASPRWQDDLLLSPNSRETAETRLWLSEQDLDHFLQDEVTRPSLDLGDQGGAPRRWWPVALSALVPGLGELSTGHRVRGSVMIAADAGLWYGVKDQNDKGNDLEDDYIAFADEHYSQQQWENSLAQGALEAYFDLPPGSVPENVALYVPKDVDSREWYENIGKWDVFAWGWEEYADDPFGYPGDPDNPNYDTPLRAQYVSMRGKSNDAFDKRDRFLSAAILLRVFSVLQMAYLEGFVGGRYSDLGPAEGSSPQMGWYIEPQGLEETRVGLKVSY